MVTFVAIFVVTFVATFVAIFVATCGAAGRHEDLRSVLRAPAAGGGQVLSLRSAWAKLNRDHLVTGNCGFKRDSRAMCLHPDPHRTILQMYNCNRSPSPKPDVYDRVRKQLYRLDCVVSHLVHYTTVTRPMLTLPPGPGKSLLYCKRPPAEHFLDKATEALMLHAKTTHGDVSYRRNEYPKKGYRPKKIRIVESCKPGIPFTEGTSYVGEDEREQADEHGDLYNCWAAPVLTPVLNPVLAPVLSPILAPVLAPILAPILVPVLATVHESAAT